MTTLLVIDKEANTRLPFKDKFQDKGYEVAVAEPKKSMGFYRELILLLYRQRDPDPLF